MRILIFRAFPSVINPKAYNVQEIGLAQALRRKGHDCDIVLYSGAKSDRDEQLADGTIIFWRHAVSVLKNGFFPGIRKLMQQYDIVQVHEYDQLQNWVLYTFQGPVPIVVYHGPYFDAFNKGYNLKCAVFDRFFLPITRRKKHIRCLTKSPLARDFLLEKGFSNVVSVGVGLNVASMEYRPENDDRDKCSVSDLMPEDRINVVYVGKLEERRNTKFLLDVIRTLSNDAEVKDRIHFTIVGDGEASFVRSIMPCIHELVHDGTLNYCVSATQAEVALLYQKGDIFVFPSNYEIFGMVLLECMNYQCVPISSINGGSTTLIRNNETGLILDSFEIEDWTRAIKELVLDDQKRHWMAEEASSNIREHYTWDALAEIFLETYHNAQEDWD